MPGSHHEERISPEFLLALCDRIKLSELIGRTVKLGREGREWAGLCPFHQEKTASFEVNDAKGRWCCYGCSAKGDAIDFLRKAHGLSFKDAVNELASGHGLGSMVATIDPVILQRAEDRRRKEEEHSQRYREAALRILAEALPAENSPVERYLRSRAIGKEGGGALAGGGAGGADREAARTERLKRRFAGERGFSHDAGIVRPDALTAYFHEPSRSR